MRALILIIIGIGLSIMLHETGHFIAAKRAGMKATEFFVGFGPKLWSIRRGETEYGIKAVLLGGYVRIIGMSNLEEVAPEDEPRTYRAAKYKDKMSVALAGVAMNVLIAMVCLFILFVGQGAVGGTISKVSETPPDTPASDAGIAAGDWIVSLDGQILSSWEDVPVYVEPRAGESIDLGVISGAEEVTLSLDPSWLENETLVVSSDGVVLDVTGAASSAGWQTGDRLAIVDGELAFTPSVALDQAGDSASVPAVVLRAAEVETIAVTPISVDGRDGPVGRIGIAPELTIVRVSPLEAAKESFLGIGYGTRDIFGAMGRIFSLSGLTDHAEAVIQGEPSGSPSAIESERVMSIVGFASEGSKLVQQDWWIFFALMFSLNLFLAILNLVPLLPLDGGHVVIGTYEKVASLVARREVRVDYGKLLPVTTVVFALILVFGVSAIVRDLRVL